MPPSFRLGNIKLRSTDATRTFTDYNFQTVPLVSYSPNFIFNTVGNAGNSVPATVLYDNINNAAVFSISTGANNNISINSATGQLSFTNTLPNGIYNLTIAATNNLGVTYNKYTIYNGSTYTINTSTGPNGTISPNGSLVTNQYAQQIFNISPNPGYLIDSLIINGVKIANTTKLYLSNFSQNLNPSCMKHNVSV